MDEASGRIADLKKDLAANKSDPVKSTAIQGYIDKLTLQYNEANKQSEKRRASFFNPIVPTIGGNFGKFKQVLLTEVDYKIEKARWDVNSATTPEKRAMAISDLTLFQNQKKSLQGLSGVEWRMMLADMQGALGTIQATRDLPANILSGRFWNVNVQGNLTPSNMSKIQIGKSGWAAGIMTPRSDISPGYAALTSAYYLTPASLAKTFLYNGEGFAYLKYLQRLNEANKLNQSGFGTQLASTLQTLMASDPDLKKSIGGFLNSGGINVDAYALNYQTFMTSLEGQKGNLGGVWSKIDGLIKKENSSALTKLTQFFGTGNRTMMRIQEAYNKRFKEKINKYVVDNIISKWLGKEVAAQLGSKLGSLGLRQVITMAVSELEVH
jgi:hypothetical protein